MSSVWLSSQVTALWALPCDVYWAPHPLWDHQSLWSAVTSLSYCSHTDKCFKEKREPNAIAISWFLLCSGHWPSKWVVVLTKIKCLDFQWQLVERLVQRRGFRVARPGLSDGCDGCRVHSGEGYMCQQDTLEPPPRVLWPRTTCWNLVPNIRYLFMSCLMHIDYKNSINFM